MGITALARALLSVAPDHRSVACNLVVSQAPAADCYRKRFNRPHPDWGNGSLLAAVRSNPLLNEPNLANAQYCHCLELVFAALRQWRLAQLNRMRSPRIIAQLD